MKKNPNRTFILKDIGGETPRLKHPHEILQAREERPIYFMRRMIDQLAPGRKLILVYLQQKQIPRDVYINAPQVALFEIPLPGPEERRAVSMRFQLSQELISYYANLTEGLSVRETMRILEQAPHYMNAADPDELQPADIEKAIKRFKFGERPDAYEMLSVPKLRMAYEFFAKGKVVNDQGESIDTLPGVSGQDEAIRTTERMLWRAKANVGQLLRDPGSLPPRGVLFFCGPSGTGKTMLAKRIARFLFDSEEAFTRFDMSEYMQDFAVSKLIGAPLGYVGSEHGGQLTNAVRRKPFSVILFDEVEKAHPRVLDIFLQILSDGLLTDSLGQVVFFSETIMVFTSNIGMRSQRTAGTGVSGAIGSMAHCNEMNNYRALMKKKRAMGRDTPAFYRCGDRLLRA